MLSELICIIDAISPPLNYYRASMRNLGKKTFTSDLIKVCVLNF